jgi:hypothetical protein
VSKLPSIGGDHGLVTLGEAVPRVGNRWDSDRVDSFSSSMTAVKCPIVIT